MSSARRPAAPGTRSGAAPAATPTAAPTAAPLLPPHGLTLPPDAHGSDEAAREFGRQLAMDGLLTQALAGSATGSGGATGTANATSGRHSATRRPASRRLKRVRGGSAAIWWVGGALAALAVLAWMLTHSGSSPTVAPGGANDQQTNRMVRQTDPLPLPPVAEPRLNAVVDVLNNPSVRLLRSGKRVDLKAGMALENDDQLQSQESSAGIEPAVRVRYADGTVVELQSGAQAVFRLESGAKVVALAAGTLHSEIAPQPTGRAMRFKTAAATATVVGTEINLSVQPAQTRLDVLHGRVEWQRASGQGSVFVSMAQYCEIATSGSGGGGDSTLPLQVQALELTPGGGSVAKAGNLLVNAGFENGTQGWTVNTPALTAVVDVPVHAGQHALELHRSADLTPRVWQAFAVTAGDKVEAAGWLKSVDAGKGDCKIWLFWYDAAGDVLPSNGVGPAGTQDWTYFSQIFVVPPGAVRCEFTLKCHADPDGEGTGYFDDLYCGRKP